MTGIIIAFVLGAAFGEAIRHRAWTTAGCFGIAIVINALAGA